MYDKASIMMFDRLQIRIFLHINKVFYDPIETSKDLAKLGIAIEIDYSSVLIISGSRKRSIDPCA
jgi:hypothetical protein